MEIQSQLWPKAKTNRKIDPNWVCVGGGGGGGTQLTDVWDHGLGWGGVGWRCWEGINKNSIKIIEVWSWKTLEKTQMLSFQK